MTTHSALRVFSSLFLIAWLTTACSVRREVAKVPVTLPVTAAPGPPQLNGDSADQAAEFFRMKRWQGPGDLPVERYLQASSHASRLPISRLGRNPVASGLHPADANPAALGTWQPLGPGNIGGRTRAIVIDPGRPNVIYAGTATGGVWKTVDSGQNWLPLTDFLPVLSVSSLIMDPIDSQTLYLGTGETTPGVGIFKTTDGGLTWNQLSATANSNFSYVYSLAIHPQLATHLYAATASGLFVSIDSGSSWKKSYPTAIGTFASCNSLALQTDQPKDVVFAACGSFVNGKYTSAVYRNQDAAGTGSWSVVQSDPLMGTLALAVAPNTPATVYAISTTNDQSSPFRAALLGVYRSTQSGDPGTWTTQADTHDPQSVNANLLSYADCVYDPTDHHGQGGYNLNIAVDPTDANVVFVQGITLFRSDDGGLTWGGAVGATGMHTDHHALAFHPAYDGKSNQTLLAGNDGGIYRTDQARGIAALGPQAFCAANSKVAWVALNNGYASTQFYHGAVLPGGQGYFGGTQDNGTPLGTDVLGANKWTSLFGGDGGQVAVDPQDANSLFFEYIHLNMDKSIDGGKSNHPIGNGITEASANFLFINYFAHNPADFLQMYTGGSQLWRSLDGGENWTAASAPAALPAGSLNQFISTEAISPSDSNQLLFGTTSGAIFRNNNALTSTNASVLPYVRPRPGYVSRLTFDPQLPTTVYATYSSFRTDNTQSQIYKSFDGGVSWLPLGNTGDGALPDLPVHVLLVDPDDSSRLYIGTDTGVFVSFDGGTNWARDGNPFGEAITETLQIQKSAGSKYLYAFTFGRGVWRLNLSPTSSECTYSVSSNAITLDATDQIGSIRVDTAPGCSWTARPGKSIVTVQSPANGVGAGTVFFRASSNASTAARTDAFYVQNQTVTVAQSGDATNSHNFRNDEVGTARAIPSLPYSDVVFGNQTYTANATDPVHTCTSSSDLKTQWWKFTATATAPVLITVTGKAYSFYGDAGLVITAYPLAEAALGNEAGCTLIPRNANVWTPGTMQFNAIAGTSYVVEISGINTNNTQVDLDIAVLPTLSLTPGSSSITAGQTQQFSAAVLNTPNIAVRWSVSPPLGTVSASGLYTAPSQVSSATPITLIARSFANANASASAALTLQPAPTFTAAGVTNGASYGGGAVAPGELINLFGTSLGPATLAGATLDASGKVATQIAGTRVLFGSIAAPLVYSSAGQVSAIVPYAVAGKTSTEVQVQYNGQTTLPVTIPVIEAAPALFTANSSGQGPAAILNQDGLVNPLQFAAGRGSTITMFGTGEGQTVPGGVDGQLASATLTKPVLPVSVQIDGKQATVQYAGAAPGNVAGVFQINAIVPLNATPGLVPVIVAVGPHASPANVMINVLGPDDRNAIVAYNNTGTASVTIKVFKPGTATAPITVGTVAGGKYFSLGPTLVGSDWGIQVNSSAIRVISHVCGFSANTTPQYWTCGGTVDAPFPR